MTQPHSISEKKVQPSASKRGRYLVPSPLAMLLFRDTVNLKETSQSILLKQASHFLLCRGGFCGSQSSLPSTLIFLHTMETTMETYHGDHGARKCLSMCLCVCKNQGELYTSRKMWIGTWLPGRWRCTSKVLCYGYKARKRKCPTAAHVRNQARLRSHHSSPELSY